MEKYNGWSNYATWRVNLEILGDIEFEDVVTVDDLKEIVEECVFTSENNLEEFQIVRAFLNQVNYYEIANIINEEL